MHRSAFATLVAAALVGGCATTGDSMSPEQLAECLQPNRRVVVELVGVRPLPAPKPKPGEPAPKEKPKVQMGPLELQGLAQGNSAFDIGGATLKKGGMDELDEMLASAKKQNMRIDSVIIAGHTDRLEEGRGMKSLSEDRAKSVMAYLSGKGIDQKLIFWEGKAAREAVPVTKFCS
jgi:outer membrane protein OmpA-like peptidoglycan-associated protein